MSKFGFIISSMAVVMSPAFVWTNDKLVNSINRIGQLKDGLRIERFNNFYYDNSISLYNGDGYGDGY